MKKADAVGIIMEMKPEVKQKDDLWESLFRMVKAENLAYESNEALEKIGFRDAPFFHIYGNLIDAIYSLIGEKTDTLEESVSYKILRADFLDQRQKTNVLYYEYMNRHGNACPSAVS